MNIDSVKGFEVILDKFGSFSKYNIITYCFLLAVVFFYGLHQTAFVFVASDINYRCKIEQCENSNTSLWLDYAIPKNKESTKCKMYSFKQNLTNTRHDSCAPELFDNSTETYCNSYVYSDEGSIVKDFNLACQDGKRTLLGTIGFIGNLVTLPIIGILSDNYGRKPTVIVTIVTLGILEVIKSFSINFEMMLVLEFLGSGLGPGAYTTAFVFAMELVKSKDRVPASTVLHIVFGLGHVTYGGLAWILRSWRNLLRVMGAPTLLFISYIWIIDESTRWLLSKRRNQAALEIIKKAARMNKLDLSDNVLSSLCMPERGTNSIVDEKNKTSLIVAIKSNVIRKRLIVCSFLFVTCNFVYYGLTINSVSLAGNKYLNFLLVAATEIPSNIICFFVMDKFGRKKTLTTAFVLSGIFCISLTFLSKDQNSWSILLYLLGMLSICMAFVSVYTYGSELFPTNIRQSMISTCTFFGRIGSMLSASTPLLAMYNEHLPAVIFGSLGLVAGVLVLTLPETSNVVLPDTIDEAEIMCSQMKMKRKDEE